MVPLKRCALIVKRSVETKYLCLIVISKHDYKGNTMNTETIGWQRKWDIVGWAAWNKIIQNKGGCNYICSKTEGVDGLWGCSVAAM